MFVLPLAASLWLYRCGTALAPRGRLNYGRLVEPPRPLPELRLAAPPGAAIGQVSLRGHWSLIQIAGASCGTDCRESLALTRAVRLALGRDRGRLQRVLLAAAGCCDWGALAAEHPDLVSAPLEADAGARLAAALAGAGDGLYLVDPLGNLMMCYPPRVERGGLRKDLERLLHLSQIG